MGKENAVGSTETALPVAEVSAGPALVESRVDSTLSESPAAAPEPATGDNRSGRTRHPRGFYYLFSIEMWERFGFYGMSTVLVLFVTTVFGIPETEAVLISSSFSALVYAFVAVGGWVADKVLGTKRTLLTGIIFLALGYILISLSASVGIGLFIGGLAVVAVGSGFFKSAPSSMLPLFYEKDDKRLDGAFTLYYMSINIGSLVAMAIVPVVANIAGWGLAFGLSVLGMLVALGSFTLARVEFRGKGSKPDLQPVNKKKLVITLVVAAVAVGVTAVLLSHSSIATIVLVVVSIVVIAVYLGCALKQQGSERKNMLVALALIIEAFCFFVLYYQMPTSINLYAIHNVDAQIFGITFDPVQCQMLNPIWILVFSPLLARFYLKTGDRFPLLYRFAAGMIVSSLGFAVLAISSMFHDANGLVSVWWLVASYLFQSVGELMISGLGLSILAKLVPQRLMGFTMGAWFTASSVSSIVAGMVANTAVASAQTQPPIESVSTYGGIFTSLAVVGAIAGVIMLLVAGKLQKAITVAEPAAEPESEPEAAAPTEADALHESVAASESAADSEFEPKLAAEPESEPEA